MGDLSLGVKNSSDAGTELILADTPWQGPNYLLWVNAELVFQDVIGIGGFGGAGVWGESRIAGGMGFPPGPGPGVFGKGKLGVRLVGAAGPASA